MKTKKDYTPEIRGKIAAYKARCVQDLYNGNEHKNWKRKDTVDYINYIYALCKHKEKPVVIVADDILQYRVFFNILFKTKLLQKKVNALYLFKNRVHLHWKISTKTELDSELRSELD